MQGRRLPDGSPPITDVQPGDYWKSEYGHWFAKAPNGFIGNLKGHEVVEHDDGTITVSPSMLVDDGESNWHGYLEKGVWRSC